MTAAIAKAGKPAGQTLPSIAALMSTSVTIDVTPPSTGRMPPAKQYLKVASPLADQGTLKQYYGLLLDKTTTTKDTDLVGRVNVNTAPKPVLQALPLLGANPSIIDAIIAQRPTGVDPTDPTYSTPAWLATDANVPPAVMSVLERLVTARSQVYRVQSLGYFEQAGPIARVEAVIDTNQGNPRMLYYRDLTDLGRSLDPRTNK